MVEKILVPLDGSDLAEHILPYVSHMARGLRATAHLLSVVDPDAVEVPNRYRRGGTDAAGGAPYASQVFDKMKDGFERHLAQVASDLRARGVDAEWATAFGPAAEEIVRMAHDKGCDLIAMATHGRTVLGRGVLGSVTDRVVHSSTLPVLAMEPEQVDRYLGRDLTIATVVVPLDGSPLAEGVLPHIIELARGLSLNVLLMRVVTLIPYGHVDGYFVDGFDPEADLSQEATEYLGAVATRLRAEGLEVETRVMTGHPAQCIVQVSRETPNGIVAIATRGRSGLRRWLIGSVAESVVRSSGEPVLIVPPRRTEPNR